MFTRICRCMVGFKRMTGKGSVVCCTPVSKCMCNILVYFFFHCLSLLRDSIIVINFRILTLIYYMFSYKSQTPLTSLKLRNDKTTGEKLYVVVLCIVKRCTERGRWFYRDEVINKSPFILYR